MKRAEGISRPPDANVALQPVDEAEMDEMWSVVGDKWQPRWLWQAIEHHRGPILASVWGTHTATEFVKLKQLLAPCGSTRF
jgi:IS1 family transposase